MKALFLRKNDDNGAQPRAPYRIEIAGDVPKPVPREGEALVRVRAAALNRRDEWIRRGEYARIQPDCILGSDACGVVEAVGAEQDEEWLGKEVVINPSLDWGENPRVQGKSYHILGMPTNGVFAEYCVVPTNRLYDKPAHLSAVHAAALPLAGLTAYRAARTHGEIAQGQNVLITGIGGGVALFAAQFAVALGARVFCTSGSEEKIRRAKETVGVAGGALYTADDWSAQLAREAGEFDCIIDGAVGDEANALLGLLKMGGRYVFYGATRGRPAALNAQMIFWKQLRLQGSTMGNDAEFADMLCFVSDNRLQPVVDSVRPFERITEAFDDLARHAQFGKTVVIFDENL
jgi:NADPH:quinone reductase-like Zn-dependent oxidoreductase